MGNDHDLNSLSLSFLSSFPEGTCNLNLDGKTYRRSAGQTGAKAPRWGYACHVQETERKPVLLGCSEQRGEPLEMGLETWQALDDTSL